MGETADRFLLCVLLIGSLGSRSTAQTFQHRYDALDQLKTEVGFGIERANNSTYMLFLGSAYSDSLVYSSVVTTLHLDADGHAMDTGRVVNPTRATYPGFANVAFPIMNGGFGVCGSTYANDQTQRPALYLFDSSGHWLDMIEYGVLGQEWIGRQGKQTLDGGFVICGETTSVGVADAFLIKTDSMGNQQWVHTYGHPTRVDYAVSVDLAPSGGYYIGGKRDAGGSSYDPWVFRVDANGSQIWSHNYGSPLNELPNAHIQTLADSSVVFGSAFALSNFGNSHISLGKVDPSGSTVWFHTYGSIATCTLFAEKEISPGGDLICAGVTYDPAYEQGLMLRTNSNGDSLWMRLYHYYDSLYTEGEGEFRDVLPTDDGGFIAVGTTYGTHNPDDPPAPYSQDTWVVKVDSLGCIEPGCDVITGITSFITNLRDAISVYPNPAHESVLVGIDLPSNFKPDGSLRLSLVNEQGVLVKEQRIANMATVVFDLGGVASGLYTLHLSDNSQWIAGAKVIVQ